MSTRIRTLVLAALGLAASGLFIAEDAAAYVGNPLTPVSVAGVSRRTARRTTRRQMAYGGYGYGTAYAAPAPASTTIINNNPPPGATPYYQGSQVVYVQE
jgi:hypothetical protein